MKLIRSILISAMALAAQQGRCNQPGTKWTDADEQLRQTIDLARVGQETDAESLAERGAGSRLLELRRRYRGATPARRHYLADNPLRLGLWRGKAALRAS